MKTFDYSGRVYTGKTIPEVALKQFGNIKRQVKTVEVLEDLRKDPPNIIIAECMRNAQFTQNQFKSQFLKKKAKYVMNLGAYKQLWYDPYRKWKVLKPSKIRFANIYRPYTGQNLEDKTLLVMRTGGIGDLLFILPNLMYLKSEYPSSTIKLACGPQYHAMVENWEPIDEVVDLPFPLNKLIQANYHAVFEGVIERCIEATKENSYRLFTKWLGLNLPDELLVPKQKPKEDKVEACKHWMDKNQLENFAILQIRASSPIRTPRPDFWKKLIHRIVKEGLQVVITDVPFIAEQVDEFISTLDKECQSQVFNFCEFSSTLDFTIALTSLAKCSISPDSAIVHIAASLGIPAFGIYGAFPASVRLTTYSNVDWVETKKDCSPCFTHGPNSCRNSIDNHPTCYDTIDIDECITKIKGLIDNATM